MAASFIKAAKDDTWRMRILADTRAAQRSVSTGEILDLSVEDALDLLRSGKAERYVEPIAPKVPHEVAPVVPAREPEPSDSSAEGKSGDDAGKKPSKETKGEKK